MEDNNYYEIDLDIWKQYPIKKIITKQLDIGRKIRVNLYSNGYKYNISNSRVTVYIKKNKENIVFNNCKIIDTNTIEIEITSSMVENIGIYNAEIDIISDGISTFNFIIEVIETNKDVIQITQTSEYGALVDSLKSVQEWDKYFKETSGKIEEKYTTRLNNKVDLKDVRIYPLLTEEIEALNIVGQEENVIDLRYEYGHINRYGAKKLGYDEFNILYNKLYTTEDLKVWDSSKAIQTAVFVVEKMASNRKGVYPVRFGGGTYLVTKTIICKATKINGEEIGEASNPLSFVGVYRKTISSKWATGTQIIPMIANTNFIANSKEGYANLFAINIEYRKKNEYEAPDSDYRYEVGKPYKDLLDEELYDTNIAFHGAGVNTTICDNVAFKNLSFYIDTNVADNYNINVIKAYRTRFTIDNIYVHNMRQFMLQPPVDATGGSSYCDFSQYTNINFSRLKYRGLELYNADNSKIEDITNHFPGNNFDSLILIRGGGGITISRIHFAYSFDLYIKNEQNILVPKQLGTGINGTKAYIKLVNTRGVSVNGVYGERQLLDYLFYIYNAKNVLIENTTEAFFGNGYIRLDEETTNISIKNVYRKCNLVTDYVDIYISDVTKAENIDITNFIGENLYTDTISLTTKQDEYANLTPVTSTTKRHITSNTLNNNNANNFSLEQMTFKVVNLDGKLAILDYANNTTNDDTSTKTSAKNDYFSVEWNTNFGGFIIEQLKNTPFCIRSITPVYTTVGSMFLPISSTNGDRYRVAMWDLNNNKYMTEINTNMGFIINIEALRI